MTALLVALIVAVLAGALGYLLGGRRAVDAERRLAAAEAGRAAEQRAALEAGVRAREAAQQQAAWLEERFRAVTGEALQASSEQFLRLAKSTLDQATTASAGSLTEMVGPLRVKLGEVETHLRELESARASAYRGLTEQVVEMRRTSEQLRGETSALVTALRAPQTRGRWGEVQLRRVVESAGMLEHCDFVEQASVTTVDGRLRPDMVVRLTGGKSVVVDAKVPFSAYLEAMEARDDTTRSARRAAHARHFADHVKALSAKEYWVQFDTTPEFVVMFVPADTFLDAALQEMPALLETAFAANVVIATPSTLMALLRTIAYVWRQEALTQDARRIAELGRELYDRLGTMGGHMGKLGRSLKGAVESYNTTVGSLESRVLSSARKLRDLKVSEVELETPPMVEIAPRPLGAPELLAVDDARLLREEGDLLEHLTQLRDSAGDTRDATPRRRAG